MKNDNLAYVDSLRNGLIPCKPIGLHEHTITARITANRGAYKRGDIVEYSVDMIIPRRAVFYRSGIPHIRGYTWYTAKDGSIRAVIGWRQ